jgi:hypothetical protein
MCRRFSAKVRWSFCSLKSYLFFGKIPGYGGEFVPYIAPHFERLVRSGTRGARASEERFIFVFSFGLICFLKLTDVPCLIVPGVETYSKIPER